MTDDEFRMMLDLWMVSDPWPLSGHPAKTIYDMLMRLSKERGFEDTSCRLSRLQARGQQVTDQALTQAPATPLALILSDVRPRSPRSSRISSTGREA